MLHIILNMKRKFNDAACNQFHDNCQCAIKHIRLIQDNDIRMPALVWQYKFHWEWVEWSIGWWVMRSTITFLFWIGRLKTESTRTYRIIKTVFVLMENAIKMVKWLYKMMLSSVRQTTIKVYCTLRIQQTEDVLKIKTPLSSMLGLNLQHLEWMNKLRQYGFVKCASGSVRFFNSVENYRADVQSLQTGVWAKITKDSHVTDDDMRYPPTSRSRRYR